MPPRLYILFARSADLAVIIRRGPSKQTRLILWNTKTDAFTPGQWLKARVYERRCDLSPDGSRLVYFALDGRHKSRTRGSYTAVSRPPFFTAEALWPKGDAWYGGGLFLDDRTLFLNGHHHAPLLATDALAISDRRPEPRIGNSECLGIYYPRLRRDGWRLVAETDGEPRSTDTWEKFAGRPRSVRLIKHAIATWGPRPAGRGCYFDEHAVALTYGHPPIPLPDADWADFDQRGRLVYASAGKLYHARITRDQLDPHELADFNDMTFEPIPPPPSARRRHQ